MGTMRSASGPDRLSRQDSVNLRVEDRGLPLHVGALLIVDGAPLCDPDGSFRLDAARRRIEQRLHLAPRLRQVVRDAPPGLGPPFWVDDPGFDVRDHVHERALSPPADDGALEATCVELNEPPLDRSRPLWELWFLTGLAGGRIGVLIRLHHVIADGVASVAMLGSLFDPARSAPSTPAPRWLPIPAPTVEALAADEVERRRAARRAVLCALTHPAGWLRRGALTVGLLRELIGDGRAPLTSLNRPVGRHRRLLLTRWDLERAKAAAHAHGGTVNDVVLAAVTGGARELLRVRGELAPGMVLRASVPVSIRRPEDPSALGNRVGIMVTPLPVGEPDPIRRLETIVRATAARKRRPRPAIGWDLGWPIVQRLMLRLMDHQRLVNLFVSNVIGPPAPRYFAGARIDELFQVGVLQGNVTVGVGVLSYAGRLNASVLGDAATCPDLGAFVRGMELAMEGLGAGAAAVERTR